MSYSSFGSDWCQLLHPYQMNSNALHCTHLYIHFQQKSTQDTQLAQGKSKATSLSSSLLKKKVLNSLASLKNTEQNHSRELKRSRKTSMTKPDSETWALRRVKWPWLILLSHSTLLLLQKYVIFTKAVSEALYTNSQTKEVQVCNSFVRRSRIHPENITVQSWIWQRDSQVIVPLKDKDLRSRLCRQSTHSRKIIKEIASPIIITKTINKKGLLLHHFLTPVSLPVLKCLKE